MKNWWRGVLSACTLLFSCVAVATVQNTSGNPQADERNVSGGVTQMLRDVMWFDWALLIICCGVFLIAFAAMFYSIWSHRKSRGHSAVKFHRHLGTEVVWMVIIFLIVVALALPAIKKVISMKVTSTATPTIGTTTGSAGLDRHLMMRGESGRSA